jgi:flagellar protein FlgJ
MPAAGAGSRDKEATGKVARQFEALFVGMMMKSMRSTVGQDKLTGGGHGEEMYRSMLDQEYANAIAERGGFGLAQMIERQLLQNDHAAGQGESPLSRKAYHGEFESKTKIEVDHENR